MAIVLGAYLGGGGEGSVHRIAGQPGLVAKVFHHPPAPEKIKHLRHLIAHRSKSLARWCAWPLALDRTSDGADVLVSPEISGARQIHDFYGTASRLRHFPGATWADHVRIARLVAHIIAVVHRAGFILADINEENFLIDDAAEPKLIDCDSLMSTHDGRTTFGGPFREEWLPPELIGADLNAVQRTANHDNFALANMLFRILMIGRHPYAGVPIGPKEPDEEEAVRDHHFAYGGLSTLLAPPVGAPPFALLPAEIQTYFITAFGRAGRTQRPTAKEWTLALFRLERSLRRCKTAPFQHMYAPHLGDACPWCALSPLVDAFPDPRGPANAPAPAPPQTAQPAGTAAAGQTPAPAPAQATPVWRRANFPQGRRNPPRQRRAPLSFRARLTLVAIGLGAIATTGAGFVFLLKPPVIPVSVTTYPPALEAVIAGLDRPPAPPPPSPSKPAPTPNPDAAVTMLHDAQSPPLAPILGPPAPPRDLAPPEDMKRPPRLIGPRSIPLRYPPSPVNDEVGVCLRLWVTAEGGVDHVDILHETIAGRGYGANAAARYATRRFKPAKDFARRPMPAWIVISVIYPRPPGMPEPRVVIPLRHADVCRGG